MPEDPRFGRQTVVLKWVILTKVGLIEDPARRSEVREPEMRAHGMMGRLVLVVAVAGLSSGCAVAIQGGADFRPGTDLSPYRTFTWGEPDELPTGDPRLDNNPFFVERLHEAIESELSLQGISFTQGDGDLLVHHHTSVRSRVEVFEVDRSAGYQAGEYGPESDVFEYEEGTFLVDIADGESRQILWRGWAQADIEAALSDPDKMGDLVADAVAKMFEAFPGGGG